MSTFGWIVLALIGITVLGFICIQYWFYRINKNE